MRTLLTLLGLLLLTACASPAAPQESGAPGEIASGDTSTYQMLISTSDITPDSSRLVLTLWDGEQRMTEAQSLSVELFSIGANGEPTAKVWEGTATPYDMGDVQYWVVYPEFPGAGSFGVRALVTTMANEQVENLAVVRVKEEPDAPALGEPAPRSDTLTLKDVSSIEELVSAAPYHEEFYQLTVAEAAESGKPSIIAFSTPGYCTSSLCAPVMETLATVSGELGDAVNVVHVEVWRNYERQEYDSAVQEWNLKTEPWIFVLNADGTIGARLEGPVGPEELREAVAEVRGG